MSTSHQLPSGFTGEVEPGGPELTLPDDPQCESPDNAARLLAKYGFYFALSMIAYAVLFPFSFDFTWNHISKALSEVILVPYWDSSRGLRIVPDDLGNILLMLPLGFAGILHCGKKFRSILLWGVLGFAVGAAAEIVQLAVETRATVVADAINNGIGAMAGAAAASVFGRRALKFFTGTAAERRNVYLWMVTWCLVAMLGPYELGPDYPSRFQSAIAESLVLPICPARC